MALALAPVQLSRPADGVVHFGDTLQLVGLEGHLALAIDTHEQVRTRQQRGAPCTPWLTAIARLGDSATCSPTALLIHHPQEGQPEEQACRASAAPLGSAGPVVRTTLTLAAFSGLNPTAAADVPYEGTTLRYGQKVQLLAHPAAQVGGGCCGSDARGVQW